MSITTTTTSSISTVNPLEVLRQQELNDPIYGSAHRILQHNYIGSWADADYKFTKIRRAMILAELEDILAQKATKLNSTKAHCILSELKGMSYDNGCYENTKSLVTAWEKPKPSPLSKSVTVSASSGGKASKNGFAALVEDSDDE